MRFRSPLRCNVLVGSLLLAVAMGCSEDAGSPSASVVTSPMSTAPSSSAPSSNEAGSGQLDVPAEPPLPRAATKRTDKGAKSFARYWAELVNYSGTVGTTAALRSQTDARCSGCLALVDLIERTYANGGRVEGGNWKLGRLRELPLDHGADWAGYAPGEAMPQKIFDGDGGSKFYRGGRFHYYAYLGWTADGWKMLWLRTPDAKS